MKFSQAFSDFVRQMTALDAERLRDQVDPGDLEKFADLVGVRIELESEDDYLREVLAWQDIKEAPDAPARFWVKRPPPNDDMIILVQRSDHPEHRNSMAPDAIAVVSYRHGVFFWPLHFISIDNLSPKEPDE